MGLSLAAVFPAFTATLGIGWLAHATNSRGGEPFFTAEVMVGLLASGGAEMLGGLSAACFAAAWLAARLLAAKGDRTIGAHALAGCALGAVPTALLAMTVPPLGAAALLAGMVGALATSIFWLVARPDRYG